MVHMVEQNSAEEGVLVLDGAQGTELERRGLDLSGSKLWSAQLLLDNPSLVAEVHRSYLDSGMSNMGCSPDQMKDGLTAVR